MELFRCGYGRYNMEIAVLRRNKDVTSRWNEQLLWLDEAVAGTLTVCLYSCMNHGTTSQVPIRK